MPPGNPCDGLTGGVFPAPPALIGGPPDAPPPPPEPPAQPAAPALPYPPPAEVIDEPE